MSLISVTYGRETFTNPSKSCNIQVYFRPALQADDRPIVDAVLNKAPGIVRGNFNSIPASRMNTHHGYWTECTVDVADGGALAVRVTKTGTNTFGAACVAVMLLARQDAPLHRLSIPLTRHPKAEREQAYIEGRFDIVRFEDFVKMGVRVPKGYLNNYAADWEDYIDVAVLDRQITPMIAPALKTLETSKGTILLKRTNRRKIRLK